LTTSPRGPTLSGDNTDAGTTTIQDAGTQPRIGAGGTTGSLGLGGVSNSGELVFNRSDALGVANVISGSGSLTQAGSRLPAAGELETTFRLPQGHLATRQPRSDVEPLRRLAGPACHRARMGIEPLEACLLIAEWPTDTEKPTKFFFSNLPAMASRKELVRLAKRRRWVEHSSKELKDELGLDHFEGRSWRGRQLRKRLGKKGIPA